MSTSMLIGAGAAAAVACYFLYSRSAKQPTIKIGYWAIRGLGAPCRMAAAYGGIPYESVEYEVHKLADGSWSRSSWLTDAKPALVEQNAMMNLPYVVDGDIVVTQSNACLMYLGRKVGLVGKTADELCAVEQVLCQVMDLRNATAPVAYNPEAIKGACKGAAHLKDTVPVHFKKLNGFITQRGTKYSAADTVTVADFHLWEMIEQAVRLAAFLKVGSPLDGYDKLAAIYASLRADPKLAEYFASASYALPQNNKMAGYGGDRNDGR